MNAQLERIIESKRALRRELSLLPVAEKLRLLDLTRERKARIPGPRPKTTLPDSSGGNSPIDKR